MVKQYTSADGNVIAQNTPFVLDGIAYPHNWLELASAEDLYERSISLHELPDPEPLPQPEAIDPKTDVIHNVTARQARLALLSAGLLDQVEQAVVVAGGVASITWEYATEISRNDPLIATIGQSLGLTDAAIDLLFRQASTL